MAIEKSLIVDVQDQIEAEKESAKIKTAARTPAEFLKDDAGKALYAKYLQTNSGSDPETMEMLAKYNAGDMSLDVKKFADKTREYGERLAAAELLADKMSPEFAARLGKLSPEFGKYVDLVGPDKMSDIWKKKLPELMVTDPAKFEKIKTAVKSYETQRNIADEKIKKTAEKLGVQPERFANVIAISDPKRRAEELKPLLNTWRSAIYSALGKFGEWRNARNAMKLGNRARKDVESSIQVINQSLKSLCQPLVEMIEGRRGGSQIINIAFKSVLFGKDIPGTGAEEVSFSEAKKFKTADALRADMNAEWTAEKAKSSPRDATTFKRDYLAKAEADVDSVANGSSKSPGVWSASYKAMYKKQIESTVLA